MRSEILNTENRFTNVEGIGRTAHATVAYSKEPLLGNPILNNGEQSQAKGAFPATAAGGGVILGSEALLPRLYNSLSSWIGRSRQRAQLRYLDQWMLNDIGLSRQAALKESSKWFWQS